jgi:hypothetical protein
MSDISDILPQIKGKDLYLYLNKETPDWSNSGLNIDLNIHFSGNKVSLPLIDDKNTLYLTSALHHFVEPQNIIIAWSSKDIFSYLKGRTEIKLELDNLVYDLSIISSYFAFKEERPNTFNSALKLLVRAMKEPGWKTFYELYEKVYAPLATKALPDIETNCLIDNSKKKCVYPTYMIEGQANGRLKAIKLNSCSYNPHSIGDVEKASLRPRDYDEVFVYFDYKNMEVNVLQWLSKDQALLSILESGKDLYKEIWRQITKQNPTDKHRTLCKNIFLPVVFGQGAKSLSKKLEVSEEIASKLIDSLVRTFPVAFDWVKNQSPNSNNMAIDAFGRKRIFDDQEHYKVKNFCIQSPASMICLRKLVRLHEALAEKASICFHVHDGYCVLCKKTDVNTVSKIGIDALEEEDPLFSGLKLKTTCQFGHSLNDLQTLNPEVTI